MATVKFNQAHELQIASQILNVDVKELSLIPTINNENYDFEEIVMIYKYYEDDDIDVCANCRSHNPEVERVVVYEGNWDNPTEYENICECGREYEADKPTLEEWLFITK